MAIEYRPPADALDERLATLHDPELAEQLLESNPSLYVRTLAQRDREARKRLGIWGASIAGTAIVSVALGFFAGASLLKPFAAHPKQQPAVTAPPRPIAAPALPRHHAVVIPVHHAAVQHHAAPVPRHVAPPVNEALIRERRAQQAEMRRLEARVAAEEAAARQAQEEARAAAIAAAREHRAAEARAAAAAAAAAAHPATSASTATSTATTTSTAQTTTQPLPDGAPPPSSGTKTGPPPGSWTEHWPAAGGPVMVGRDPCTPPGGRIGSVLQSAAAGMIIHGLTGGRL